MCCLPFVVNSAPRKTIVSNFFVRVETQLCVATSNWPVEGKELRQPSLSFREGQQIVILVASGETDCGAYPVVWALDLMLVAQGTLAAGSICLLSVRRPNFLLGASM